MSIQWVQQGDANGCLLASLAMLTGKSYAEVKADWPDDHDWGDHGTPASTAQAWLMQNGYSLRIMHKFYGVTGEQRKCWPPEPFADVHLCSVVTSRSHAVVMTGDGTVLDPLTPDPKRLSDYQDVPQVVGVYKISERQEIVK